MTTKPKPLQWGFYLSNGKLFEPLRPEESAILNEHEAAWKEFVDGGQPWHPLACEPIFESRCRAAELGDESALEFVAKFATLEAYSRHQRIMESGRTARFNREQAGQYREVYPILARLRGLAMSELGKFREASSPYRKRLGLKQSTCDVEAAIAGILADLDRAANVHCDDGFQSLPSNITNFRPISDDE